MTNRHWRAATCCSSTKSYEATFQQRLEWYNYLGGTEYAVDEEDIDTVKQFEKYFEQSNIPKRILNLQMTQRSADVFLGVPYNIASYSLLLMMIAQLTDHIPYEYIHVLGDYHIYSNHLEQCLLQTRREPRKLPRVLLNPTITSINNFTYDDVELINYHPHPHIKGKVSI